MITKVILPSGGQTTNESIIAKWYKEEGDCIKKGDVLFEIETDKATLEVESFTDGFLLKRFFKEGDVVQTGEVVGYIGEKKDSTLDEEVEKPIHIIQKKNKKEVLEEKHVKRENVIFASPAAKHFAKTAGISLKDVINQADKEIIKKQDILSYIEQSKKGDESCYYIETSPMRRTIAKRMQESVNIAPTYTISCDIDMTECIKIRNELNTYLENKEVKVSFNDIIIKCATKAIEKYPIINSSYGDERIKIHRNINFGVAISLDEGLIVTIVKKTETKTISQIAEENSKNIKKARNQRLLQKDIEGGTITLSNLGMFGIDSFKAIINQPESCILAVGQIRKRPIVHDEQIIIKPIMTLTATFDHRVIDGAVGAAFTSELKEILEKPIMFLIQNLRGT